jgi:hypothetical protein
MARRMSYAAQALCVLALLGPACAGGGRHLLQPIDPVYSTAVPAPWTGVGYVWGSNSSALSKPSGTNPTNGLPVTANGPWRAGDTFVSYAPGFSSGVASGDPLPGQIILWTRFQVPGDQSAKAAADPANTAYTYGYSPAAGFLPVAVSWWVNDVPSASPTPSAQGTYTTDGSRDWTVKLDVNYGDVGTAGTVLYYGFTATYASVVYNSPIGSFRAINLANNAATINYAVASCSNWVRFARRQRKASSCTHRAVTRRPFVTAFAPGSRGRTARCDRALAPSTRTT